MSEVIDANALFNESEKDKQAIELRKLLIVAGLNVEQDLADPEIMEIIQKVLEDFNPSKQIDEGEAIFESQFAMFDKTLGDQSSNIRQRRGVEKHVREGYYEEMQQAMKTHDRLQEEKERKAKNTANL